MNTGNDKQGAAVKFPPPLIFLAVIFTAYGVHYFFPIELGSSSVLKYIGILVVIWGIVGVFLALDISIMQKPILNHGNLLLKL